MSELRVGPKGGGVAELCPHRSLVKTFIPLCRLVYTAFRLQIKNHNVGNSPFSAEEEKITFVGRLLCSVMCVSCFWVKWKTLIHCIGPSPRFWGVA